MDCQDAVQRRRCVLQPTAINPFLDGDMGFRFKLKVSLAGIIGPTTKPLITQPPHAIRDMRWLIFH
jgi:hypothetical protein